MNPFQNIVMKWETHVPCAKRVVQSLCKTASQRTTTHHSRGYVSIVFIFIIHISDRFKYQWIINIPASTGVDLNINTGIVIRKLRC